MISYAASHPLSIPDMSFETRKPVAAPTIAPTGPTRYPTRAPRSGASTPFKMNAKMGLAGMVASLFDAAAQQGFKGSTTACMENVSPNDCVVNSFQGTNSRRLDVLTEKVDENSLIAELVRAISSSEIITSAGDVSTLAVSTDILWSLVLFLEDFGVGLTGQALYDSLSTQLTGNIDNGTFLALLKASNPAFASVTGVQLTLLGFAVGDESPTKQPTKKAAASNLGLIIGCAVGGGVLLILIIVGIIWYMQKNNQAKVGIVNNGDL